jgi:hypothetical protein
MILFPTAALQLPSGEVGNPEKLQVHPAWQLQNSYPLPFSRQAVVVSVVVIGVSPFIVFDQVFELS